MIQALIQKLLNDKNKGFKITFKTDGKKNYIYIGSGLFATLGNKDFNNFYSEWKVVNNLLQV